jgi:hypothetical protein
MGELHHSLRAMMMGRTRKVTDTAEQVLPVSIDALSRQQQQLLQTVCWPLPELLLRTGLVCSQSDPLFEGAAATAAACVMGFWHAPGMEAAAAAAKPQRLPALLDCWLQLMQRLLLQSPLASCRHAAAAHGSEVQQLSEASQHSSANTQQQQPLSLLQQVAATARILSVDSVAAFQLSTASQCSCVIGDEYSGTFSELDSSSSSSSGSDGSIDGSFSIVSLRCDSLKAVYDLLTCLGAVKVRGLCGLCVDSIISCHLVVMPVAAPVSWPG